MKFIIRAQKLWIKHLEPVFTWGFFAPHHLSAARCEHMMPPRVVPQPPPHLDPRRNAGSHFGSQFLDPCKTDLITIVWSFVSLVVTVIVRSLAFHTGGVSSRAGWAWEKRLTDIDRRNRPTKPTARPAITTEWRKPSDELAATIQRGKLGIQARIVCRR